MDYGRMFYGGMLSFGLFAVLLIILGFRYRIGTIIRDMAFRSRMRAGSKNKEKRKSGKIEVEQKFTFLYGKHVSE